MLTASPSYGKADSSINSLRLWQNAQVLHKFKPDKPSVWRRGRHKVSSTTHKLFAINTCWEMENQLFPVESPWVYQSHSTASPMPRNGWPTHIRLHLKMLLVFCFILISFVFVVFLIFHFFWPFLFFMCFRSRGRGGDSQNMKLGV